MPEAGLTPTEQASLHAPAATLDGTAPAYVWRDLADALEPAVREAVRALLSRDGPTHHTDRADVLLEAGVSAETDAGAHALASIFAGYDRAPETDEHEAASALLRAFGQPGAAEPLGWHVPLSAVGDGPLALLGAVDATPLVAINLREAFFDQRADQRRDICQLLATLSRVADVRLLATGRQQRKLKAMHRPDLPGVSEWCKSHRGEGPLRVTVEAARGALETDGRPVTLLRALAAEPGETLAYADLYAEAGDVTESAVRQHLGRLRDLELIATFETSGGKMAELLTAGRNLLTTLDAEIGRQQSLEESVSESGQIHTQAVLPDEHGGGGGTAGERTAEAAADDTTGVPYRTVYLDRPAQAAATGAAESGTVTLVKDGFRPGWKPSAHVRGVSYDADRAEAVVSIPANGPMQYVVSLATALASPELLTRLPDARLEGIDDPPAILRSARNIGGLSEAALEDPTRLPAVFNEWKEELEDLTRKHRRGEYDDRPRLRRDMLQLAHGLAGSVVHLLDAMGIDVIRELRVPRLDGEHHDALARSVAHSAAIQSRYGAFATFRQLFEDRTDKRATALSPDVDAADPFGEVIGSYVVRGPDAHRLKGPLTRALKDPAELHEDAPEFAVPIPVREVGRGAWASAVSRILGRKRLRPTRAAVSVLHALTGSPGAAARACHQLGDARTSREVRPDELRYALATLEPEALLPETVPTVGKLVVALLRAARPLSQAVLADRADVSERSVRRHQETLEALDLVALVTDGDGSGWRLTLSFRTEAERTDRRLPAPVMTDVSLAEVVSDVAAALLPPEEYDDPGGNVFKSLLWPPDPWALAEDARLEPWVHLAVQLIGTDPPTADRTVRMGPPIEQTPLPAEEADTDSSSTSASSQSSSV